MKVKIVNTYYSVRNGRKVKTSFMILSHCDLNVGVTLSLLKDGYEVSARVAGSNRFILDPVVFSKDKFPSRKALYEYILTLAKTYGKN